MAAVAKPVGGRVNPVRFLVVRSSLELPPGQRVQTTRGRPVRVARRLWIIAVAVVATAGLEVWIGVAGSRPSPIVTVGLLATLVIVILTTCLQWYLVGGHVVAVSLYDLDPASVSAVEHVVGTVPHDADASSRRLLLVDGAEAVLQGRADLLRVVADAAKQAGVGVVVVTRDDAYEAVWGRFAIAGSSEDLVDRGDFRVDPLGGGDLTKILERFPGLRGLADDPPTEVLLGR